MYAVVIFHDNLRLAFDGRNAGGIQGSGVESAALEHRFIVQELHFLPIFRGIASLLHDMNGLLIYVSQLSSVVDHIAIFSFCLDSLISSFRYS